MRARIAGFSYIELLISTTIIGICYVMLMGSGSALGQSRAKAQCAEHLAQLHQSLTLYAAEHEGAYPQVTGATSSEAPLSLLVPLYTTDTSLFICPGSKDLPLPPAQPFPDRHISYAYYMGLRKDAPAGTPLVSDAQATLGAKTYGAAIFSAEGGSPGNKHRSYGGNLLFVDGHVETCSAMLPRDLTWPADAVPLNPQP